MSSDSNILMRETILRAMVSHYLNRKTAIIFSFSVHLLHAWILCAYQGEDDVLQLQERGGGGAGEVAQHTAGEEGGD